MPELTVSMPTYNTGKYIEEAIESVLRQDDIDFELIVVNDGSQDNTKEVVQSFEDPRIRLIENKATMGVAYCHNLVIEQSSSPFIAHVDSDDLVLPGGLRKMVSTLESAPNTGHTHCYYFDIDEDGKITRNAFRERRKYLLEHRKPDMDYKRELLVHGPVINHLRTYRREVFQVVGKFNEKLKSGVDYEMALRIIEKYDIRLVPEFLYCNRTHKGNTSESLRFRDVRFCIQRVRIVRQLLRDGNISFPRQEKYNVTRLMIVGLYHALWFAEIFQCLKRVVLISRRVRSFIKWHMLLPMLRRMYYKSVDFFSHRWINLKFYEKGNESTQERRIAYYLWQFPILSQTFIQREVGALRKSALSCKVFADVSEDIELFDEKAKTLMENTHYLLPIDTMLLSKYKRYFFLKNPFLFLKVFLYVVTHKYGDYKTPHEDFFVFRRAVYLAGILKDKNISHLHSPWADRCAFISLIASRLLGVPYTVQARAHDIHRKTFLYALPEKFKNAKVVITNTRYNKAYIQTLLHKHDSNKVKTIYNGIDLEVFIPEHKMGDSPNHTRIVSVARLIEQKGLTYLLKACKIVKDRGYSFKCEVIGGPEEPLYTNYYIELKKLRRELGLEDSVFFLGAQPFQNVLEKYISTDIFILPCVLAKDGSRDIIPNSLIEAMAMKLPVISTNITGIPEIVEDGVSGILVPPNDEHALSEAVVKLIEDCELRKELGKNARKRIEEKFDINKNVIQYIDLFERKG